SPLDATEFVVSTYTTGDQFGADVAVGEDGNFVVVWQTPAADGQYHVMARLFAPAGTPLGPEFIVSEYTTRSQFRPRVSMAPDGRFVVAWYEWVVVDTDVFARRFAVGGAPLGSDFRVNAYTTASQD